MEKMKVNGETVAASHQNALAVEQFLQEKGIRSPGLKTIDIAKICIILELFLITHTAAAQIPAAEDHRRIS